MYRELGFKLLILGSKGHVAFSHGTQLVVTDGRKRVTGRWIQSG